MAFAYAEYHDLVEALLAHPEWRAELRPLILGEEFAALPDVARRTDARIAELTAIVASLAEAQGRTEAKVGELAEAQGRTEAKVEKLTDRINDLVTAINSLNGRVSQLEGSELESKYHHQLASYLGDFLRRPKAISPYDLPLLMEAAERGEVTAAEVRRIRLLDVLAIGQEPGSREEMVLACELSYTVNVDDVDRAEVAATTLRRVGYRARAASFAPAGMAPNFATLARLTGQ